MAEKKTRILLADDEGHIRVMMEAVLSRKKQLSQEEINRVEFMGRRGDRPAFAEKGIWGGRRGSNPQRLEPQSSTLPLSYAHHNAL